MRIRRSVEPIKPGFLKDFPQGQTQYCERFSSDPARWNLYPNLNYSGLFYAIVNLLEVFPLINTGQTAIGEAVLDTLKALMMFLDRDTLEQLPLLLASHIGVFPSELDRQVVHLLADAVLPFAIGEETFIKLSVPGVLMLVLQQTYDPCLHTWIMEGAMSSSPNIYQDLVQVIAKGTSESRVAAANLLLHYWPFPNPHIIHRKTIQYKVHAWQRITCQSTTCTEKGPSVKSCYDPVICADVADTSPPVFLCRKCADNVIAERKAPMKILTQPMQASSATCQNKDCQSQSRLAVGICFSHDCTRSHNFVPIRLCQECLMSLHANCETPHLVHHGSGCVWGQDVMWGTERKAKGSDRNGYANSKEVIHSVKRSTRWPTNAECSVVSQAISYIMYNVFQWFATTALLPNDSMGASLEQLKTDFVCDWINMAIRIHYEVFIATLSPVEEEGRHFEQTKEGLARLLALMPYDVISMETWSRVMPKWLQLIYEKCSEEHQQELKILLCKIFEPDLCPLPFETVMKFSVSLQGLSSMDIPRLGQNDLEDDDVSIHIVIIDILVLQLRLNEIAVHEQSALTEKLFGCVSLLLSVPLRTTPHECKNPELDGFADCSACQQAAFLHQMIMNMTENVSPKLEMAITATDDEPMDGYDTTSPGTSHPSSALSPQTAPGSKGASPAATSAPTAFSEGGLCFQTATVEHTGDEEFVGILPSEEVEVAMAEATTLTELDVGRETCQVVTSSLVEGIKGSTPSGQQPKIQTDDFWTTSVGRFRFSIDQLPPQLRMNLEYAEDPDVENFIMNTLKFLCLHCGALSNARREHRGFLIWIQESMMVPKLWARLRSDFVQVGELASLLLLHCISFPSGEDAFWRVVHKDFASSNWKTRFDAVGKAYVMAHVIKMAPVKGNKVVQTALSALFYHFVTSLHDPNPSVAQRAIIALRALPSQTLKMMTFCLESQFDSCILDRPIIINTIRLLTTQLPDETMLTFDFFIQRFETLVLESQLSNQSEETMFVQDLMHTDPMSEIYQRKAIEEAATAKSIVKHLREYNALKHQLSYQPSDPPALCLSRLPRWRRRGRLSEAALSCRVKILRVVTMVKVVNRWRQMAADIT
ncbi:unnamed protein product, partial [Nippostrongylus brasiliensis]|uniref:Uncoordinated protein 79 (inferred by orthology to a C. elegans protein) n=1 Tax=Nippostrongylus brasiliensis TaxID=27835 RepID=A0A158R0N1_NIPBR